jgi:hypothetical protein
MARKRSGRSFKAEMENPKNAIGRMKVPIGLYPNVARIETCLVFAQSAPIYGEYSWRNSPVRISVYLDAIDRHTIALRAGQDIDPLSGLSHAAHINACTAIIMESRRLGVLIDDRFEKDASAALLDSLTPPGYEAARRNIDPRPARTLEQLPASRRRSVSR